MPREEKRKKSEISKLPSSSGVYLFYNQKGEILYIGKAGNIYQRVKTHFQQPGFKEELFLKKVEKIGFLKTKSEIEALLLEARLIKRYQPKFNVLWRDDKNYFFVGKSKEEFPRIFITHQPALEKGEFIGPFVDGRALKGALKILRKIFPFRSCKNLPKKPCLWYQLSNCPAPCRIKAKKFPFPGANQQRPKKEETKLFTKEIKKIKEESQENVQAIFKILKGKKADLLRELKKKMKKLAQNQEFEKAARLRNQLQNLETIFYQVRIFQKIEEEKDWSRIERLLREIFFSRSREKRKIERIEGYDVSNIRGKEATGAMVVFERGEPKKSDYRRFKIKTTNYPDDLAMLKEILNRRFNHPEWKFPQLILIDGGKTQLKAALSVIRKFSLPQSLSFRVLALAKKKNQLFLENGKTPIALKTLPSKIANLILQVRDEAHRFALRYHQNLRRKNFLGTVPKKMKVGRYSF